MGQQVSHVSNIADLENIITDVRSLVSNGVFDETIKMAIAQALAIYSKSEWYHKDLGVRMAKTINAANVDASKPNIINAWKSDCTAAGIDENHTILKSHPGFFGQTLRNFAFKNDCTQTDFIVYSGGAPNFNYNYLFHTYQALNEMNIDYDSETDYYVVFATLYLLGLLNDPKNEEYHIPRPFMRLDSGLYVLQSAGITDKNVLKKVDGKTTKLVLDNNKLYVQINDTKEKIEAPADKILDFYFPYVKECMINDYRFAWHACVAIARLVLCMYDMSWFKSLPSDAKLRIDTNKNFGIRKKWYGLINVACHLRHSLEKSGNMQMKTGGVPQNWLGVIRNQNIPPPADSVITDSVLGEFGKWVNRRVYIQLIQHKEFVMDTNGKQHGGGAFDIYTNQYNGHKNQVWLITEDGQIQSAENWNSIVWSNNGAALEAPHIIGRAGADANRIKKTKWKLTPEGGILSREHSNACLDVRDGNIKNSSEVLTYPYTKNQHSMSWEILDANERDLDKKGITVLDDGTQIPNGKDVVKLSIDDIRNEFNKGVAAPPVSEQKQDQPPVASTPEIPEQKQETPEQKQETPEQKPASTPPADTPEQPPAASTPSPETGSAGLGLTNPGNYGSDKSPEQTPPEQPSEEEEEEETPETPPQADTPPADTPPTNTPPTNTPPADTPPADEQKQEEPKPDETPEDGNKNKEDKKDPEEPSEGLSTGAIVGIVIGIIVFIGLCFALYWFVFRDKTVNMNDQSMSLGDVPDGVDVEINNGYQDNSQNNDYAYQAF